jgi:UbiA prenyltransferase family
LLAGGEPEAAGRLGLSMLCLQLSIGAVNDVVDHPLDAVGKPAKPIPAGLVTVQAARTWAVLTVLAGLGLALPSGPLTTVFAGACAGLGYIYDLRLSRTTWSWLPLALALPLLLVFALQGATGSLPPGFARLLPVAFLAGGALIAANGLVDLERDVAAGKATLAVRLGRSRTWLGNVAVFTVALVAVFLLVPAVPGAGSPGSGPGSPGSSPPGLPGSALDIVLSAASIAGLPLGAVAVAIGAGLLASSRAGLRERGWELQAIGTFMVGVGWVAGVVLAGSGAGTR